MKLGVMCGFIALSIALYGKVNYIAYAALLKAHVDVRGRVDYRALSRPVPKQKLHDFLVTAGTVNPRRLNKNARLAFLLNMYNACTLKLVIDHYPVSSIRKIANPWKRKIFAVGGKKMSLDEIEHKMIRPVFKDARVHFILNCSARSCPPLLAYPLTEKNVQTALEKAARRFVNDARYNRFSVGSNGRVNAEVSMLFKWFAGDFKESYGSVRTFLAKFVNDQKKAALIQNRRIDIRYIPYHWGLNSL